MSKKGIIYLMPTPLGEFEKDWIPERFLEILKTTQCFVVEELRTARRFLRAIIKDFDIDNSTFFILNEHTKKEEVAAFLNPALEGKNIVVLSEAGCPGVADPGHSLVFQAHQKQIVVKPLIGGNSIILALMASGLNGQSFTFHGYLPIEKVDLTKFLKKIELDSKSTGYTQAFIETPYRNEKIFQAMLENLQPYTNLCVAVSLTDKEEFIQTKTIQSWKKHKLNLHKKPAVFLINAQNS